MRVRVCMSAMVSRCGVATVPAWKLPLAPLSHGEQTKPWIFCRDQRSTHRTHNSHRHASTTATDGATAPTAVTANPTTAHYSCTGVMSTRQDWQAVKWRVGQQNSTGHDEYELARGSATHHARVDHRRDVDRVLHGHTTVVVGDGTAHSDATARPHRLERRVEVVTAHVLEVAVDACGDAVPASTVTNQPNAGHTNTLDTNPGKATTRATDTPERESSATNEAPATTSSVALVSSHVLGALFSKHRTCDSAHTTPPVATVAETSRGVQAELMIPVGACTFSAAFSSSALWHVL